MSENALTLIFRPKSFRRSSEVHDFIVHDKFILSEAIWLQCGRETEICGDDMISSFDSWEICFILLIDVDDPGTSIIDFLAFFFSRHSNTIAQHFRED
jgi:hypothetical protein